MSTELMTTTEPAVTAPEQHRSFAKRLAVLTLAVVMAIGVLEVSGSSSAEASTVRPGAGFMQVDVLLDSVETQRAATSYWGAQTVCWGVTAGAWAIGRIYGAVLANLVCTAMVSVCAAQAYTARPRKRAGMTFYPFNFFCWKY